MKFITSAILITLGIVIGIFYANSKNVKNKSATQQAKTADCTNVLKISDKKSSIDLKNGYSEASKLEQTTHKNIETQSGTTTESMIDANTNIDSSENYDTPNYFSDIHHYTTDDINFENYFAKISNTDTANRLNSIESASRSGLIQNAVISKVIFNEISQLINNPTSLNNDTNAAVYYTRDLIRQWKALSPERIKPELLEHFKNLAGHNQTDNAVFKELTNLIGEN